MCYLLLLIVIINTICNTTMVLCYYCLLITISATNNVRSSNTQTKFVHAKPNLGWIQTRQNVKWGAALIVLGIWANDPCCFLLFINIDNMITLRRMRTIHDTRYTIHDTRYTYRYTIHDTCQSNQMRFMIVLGILI